MLKDRISIRLAAENDLEALCAFDQIARQSGERRDFLRRALSGASCHVAVDPRVLGYAILEYSFFEQGFVSLLYVNPEQRRSGLGSALMRHLETQCRTDKLFTSTNLSNLPMQSLLARLGYRLSGVLHDLDEGDPELVYVKYLRPWADRTPSQPA
ncbi:MAG: GNAT family N-acetyltransferase [Chloroflexi bacterium]|nr:GNAT family N-acetyltransferase [Chloroflexota bacterium]